MSEDRDRQGASVLTDPPSLPPRMKRYIESRFDPLIDFFLGGKDLFSIKPIDEATVDLIDSWLDEEKWRVSKFPPLKSDNPYVYFVESLDFIKIGYSLNPSQRLEQIRALNPHMVDGLLLIDISGLVGRQSIEKLFHRYFWECHRQGEWFVRRGELDVFLRTWGV